MGTILIAMPRTEDALHFESLIKKHGLMFETVICNTGSEVLRVSNDRDYGIVICTKNLKDMVYSELADYLPPSFYIIVLTKDATVETFSDRMIKLLLPIRTSELVSTIEMINAGFSRPKKRKEKPYRTKSKEENQIIERAKQLLMERNGMSEQEAFRYIQKTSMDTGRRSVETAEMILLL